ncbi:hypothetical protein GS429_19500 [Natronorubrum sp. JWXQ-INN-674]|uniref:Uncharacterized protein n=1 Tax=Natronorubrum halalkaliphilum TaxID=2691917 RepID=A0A6B0VQY1_9EURY|nr:hypothetical protein [Natronorubrum halalkaliphilum]MXV64211.1 hypothetical protein [Natronorubrum halalkaliphilum]
MGHERQLEADLEAAIGAVRRPDDDLDIEQVSEYLLTEDRINRYLIGLQDDCTRASFYCTATRSIAYKPVAGESPSKLVDTVTGVANREQLRDWIVDQEWSWIHPRYRWLLEPE